MNTERGKFVVFEGVGGAGKGTQIERAKNLLLANGLSVISTREPGGVEVSEEIRKLIFSLKDKKLIESEGQMVLFFAARKFWVDEIVAKNVKKGTHLLADRCYTSTGAYQGYAEGGDQNKILQISDVIMGEYKPDAVILLDVSSKTSMGRRIETEDDPFDKEKSEYFDKLVAGYREMAKTSWGDLNWYVVDGEPSADRVSDSVAKVLEDIFQKKLQK